jgi:GntR family transcriptional repressor for pyruvate dehydrogenase complex
MFKSVQERIPIKEIIVKQIEDAILDKEYLPGSKLPTENELGEQFGVSRTSVREAIQILSTRGFVSVEKGRGIFVNKITSDSVTDSLRTYLQLKLKRGFFLDLTLARQILEPGIAREAALHRTEADIEILENDIIMLKECEGDFVKLSELDLQFHIDIAKATNNVVVPLLIKPITNLLPEIKPYVYARVEEAKESAVEVHRKILDAIILKDGDLAFNEMLKHLKLAEKHANMALESQSEILNKL